MSTHPATGAVVVGIDPDGSSDAALDWAADDAARRHRPLLLLAAPAPRYAEPMAGALALLPATASLEPVLDQAAARVAARAPSVEVRRSTAHLAGASPAAPLTEVSQVADTVVVGSHGRGRLATLLMGSVSQSVAAGGGCPVVVVRGAPRVLAPEVPRHVVVGVDGSPVSAQAVGYAFTQAEARGVALTVLHAWDPDRTAPPPGPVETRWRSAAQEEDLLTWTALAGWRERMPDVLVRVRVRQWSPIEALLVEADQAELLVVGSHGWGDVRGLLLGSVSQAVLRRATVPVAVVRPHEAAAGDERRPVEDVVAT